MRLIDADELIKDRVENDPVRIAAICAPTAFDIKNIMKQFRKQVKENTKIHSMARFEWLEAIKIIKNEIEKHKIRKGVHE